MASSRHTHRTATTTKTCCSCGQTCSSAHAIMTPLPRNENNVAMTIHNSLPVAAQANSVTMIGGMKSDYCDAVATPTKLRKRKILVVSSLGCMMIFARWYSEIATQKQKTPKQETKIRAMTGQFPRPNQTNSHVKTLTKLLKNSTLITSPMNRGQSHCRIKN